MDGRPDGRTHGRRQNYIPPTSSEDNKATKLASIQCWAIIGPPAKRHLNGVSLAGQWWPAFSGIWILLRKNCCQLLTPSDKTFSGSVINLLWISARELNVCIKYMHLFDEKVMTQIRSQMIMICTVFKEGIEYDNSDFWLIKRSKIIWFCYLLYQLYTPKAQIIKLSKHKIESIFLTITLNISMFWGAQVDSSFEHPYLIFWSRNKKKDFISIVFSGSLCTA